MSCSTGRMAELPTWLQSSHAQFRVVECPHDNSPVVWSRDTGDRQKWQLNQLEQGKIERRNGNGKNDRADDDCRLAFVNGEKGDRAVPPAERCQSGVPGSRTGKVSWQKTEKYLNNSFLILHLYYEPVHMPSVIQEEHHAYNYPHFNH